MTVKELLNNPSLPANEKEILLSYVLKKDKSYLFAHSDYQLTKNQLTKYQELINRRLKGEPIQYLTNKAYFYGLEFFVDNRVLIPRVETEEMVDQALAYISSRLRSNNIDKLLPKTTDDILRASVTRREALTVVDVGTGSGNIIIAIAKNLPKGFKSQLLGIDISSKALEVAKINAKVNKVSDKITFLPGNLLRPLNHLGHSEAKGRRISGDPSRPLRMTTIIKADLILANLPYVRDHLYGVLDPQILWEPRMAILGGNDGLKYYNQLFEQLPTHLNPNGLLLYEIDGKIYKTSN